MDIIQVDPSKPIFKLGNNIIWDLSNIKDPRILDALFSSNDLLRPEKIDENHVSFCECIFDVKALIYENATTDDILSSWTIVRNDLKLDRLVIVFLRDSLYNLYLTRYFQEPDIILMLRLVYWYYRCYLLQSNYTFKHKRSEVKKKLTKGLLKQIEKISKQLSIDTDYVSVLNTLALNWEDIISRLKSKVIDQELLQTSERYRIVWFKDVWNVTSELLFAAVCGESGYTITFEPSSNDHDYDFLMNGYPVQMKSLNISDSLDSVVDKLRERKRSVDSGEITYEYVVQKILGTIRDKISEVEDALEQGARIIFINGTTDESSGSYLGQLSLEEPSRFDFTKSIELSIALVEKNRSSIPLIFCATAFSSTYYINSLAFKIPITYQKKVDKDKDIEPLLGKESSPS
jgi:hypothetical protein